MKKQILFVIPSMRSGGAEKSLLTLLTLFDYSQYDVDLLCFRHDGLFFEKIPKKVNIISDNKNYEMFDGDALTAVKYFLKRAKIFSAIDRWKYSKIYKISDSHEREEIQWRYLKRQLPKLRKRYDCVIGYLEGNADRYAVECVRAKKKFCYVHSDIYKLGLDQAVCEKTFASANSIITVSQECKASLLSCFPSFENKFFVVENITARKILESESKEAQAYQRNKDEIIINTVGRFSEPKNIPLAVDACAELADRGRNIKWYHIGDGPLRDEVRNYVEKKGVADRFIMLGEKSNPYPYIGQCDIYVQPSLFEGKSIAIDEAKCLCRPIVVTDFSTVHDQITDGINGLICRMDKIDMADKIEYLIENKSERTRLTENLSREKVGNEEEIYKLYELINK